ncbi:MAG: phenylacetate--CoA ligase family protein [Planctomycetes bacterium]|nr:phenylacetate--CoA ligase family protein [Planctomycetota bacterium]
MTLLDDLLQHEAAPRWNHRAGDGLDDSDRAALAELRLALSRQRIAWVPERPPEQILQWVEERAAFVPSMRARRPNGGAWRQQWSSVPTIAREDLALRPESLVPEDVDLDRMLVYRTAGTTGHALLVPHHARAAGAYLPLMEVALRRHGAAIAPTGGRVACFLVGAQVRTVTYPSLLTFWGGAGFAKINLQESEWRDPGDRGRFFEAWQPELLTGDPISFAELARLGIPCSPKAMITTAVAMSAGLRLKLERRFRCPVIDWYSLTETGPIGFACPLGGGYHIVPHDLYVEVIDRRGTPLPPGGRGEVTVTGGRNRYLPLLRYRTGDWGRLEFSPCACGDPMPRLCDLEGRSPVLYRAASGSVVNPVDVSRVLRELPIVQHELVQRRDGSCRITARLVDPEDVGRREEIELALKQLFGDVSVEVVFDRELGQRENGKVIPYRSELLLED